MLSFPNFILKPALSGIVSVLVFTVVVEVEVTGVGVTGVEVFEIDFPEVDGAAFGEISTSFWHEVKENAITDTRANALITL